MGHGNFEQNLNCGFQFSLHKSSEISSSRREGQNFKFHRLVLSKRQIAWAKNWHCILLSWHWRAMKSFSTIWILVSKSWNFFKQARRSNFQILLVGFVKKINCLNKLLTQQFPVLAMKSYEKFQQNLDRGFQCSLPKNGEISSSKPEGQNLKIHPLILSKR